MNVRENGAVPAIEISNLSKRFGSQSAVSNLDLQVASGQIFGFLGRNGAGKTTTIRLLLGLLRPSSGSVRIFGHDVRRDRLAAARLTSSLLEARATYDNLSGRENLDSTRRLLGLPASEIDRVLEMVEMSSDANRKVGHYSLGMRQRIGLARALLGTPRLLILDEPMNGLDPDGIREMRSVICDLPARSGVTVFLSSHILSEIQQTATHIGLMQQGRLVLQGSIDALLGQISPELYLRTTDLSRATEILRSDGYHPTPDGRGIRIGLNRGDTDSAQINRRLIEAGVDVVELSLRQATLEDLYLQSQHATGGAASC